MCTPSFFLAVSRVTGNVALLLEVEIAKRAVSRIFFNKITGFNPVNIFSNSGYTVKACNASTKTSRKKYFANAKIVIKPMVAKILAISAKTP